MEGPRHTAYRGGPVGVWGQVKTWFVFPFLWGYMFIVSSLIVCLLMLLACIVVWPFSRLLYRRIVLNLAYTSWCQFTCLCTWWSGSEVTVYLEDEAIKKYFGREHVLVLANHKYEIEWLMCWVVAERYGLLGGCKVFGKSVLRYVPLIGWMWMFTESIFLRRDWEKDRRTIIKDLAYLSEYPKDYYVTLLLYAEGTRYTEGKHRKSQEFARSRGMPELQHHLLPRTKGFTLTMHGIKDKVPAIYDFEGVFLAEGARPTLSSILYGMPAKAEIYVRRIPTATVPLETDEACDNWLHQLFREKDQTFDDFHRNGRYTKGHKLDLPMRYKDLIVTVFWFVVLCVPLIVYMINVFLTGTWLLKLGMVGLVALVYVALKLFIGVTEIEKSSSYGMDKNANSKKSQ